MDHLLSSFTLEAIPIQIGKSYSMENYQWEQELQPYNHYEEEKTSNLDNLLM